MSAVKTRAARRIAERTTKHVVAWQATAPQRAYARQKSQLEYLEGSGAISSEQRRWRAVRTGPPTQRHAHGGLVMRYEPGLRPPKRFQASADTPTLWQAVDKLSGFGDFGAS
jgi:hypothetical protein